MSFRPLLFSVLYIRAHVPVTQQQNVSHQYDYELESFLTYPCYSKPPESCVYMYKYVINFSLQHGINVSTYDTGGRTSLRSIPLVCINSIAWRHARYIGVKS